MATKKEIEEIKVTEGQEETKAEVTPMESESTGAQTEKKMGTGAKLGIGGAILLLVGAVLFGAKKILG